MEKPRLIYIDNLRILLITLVIMVHLSVTYGGVGSWYYVEGRADQITAMLLTLSNAISQSFFMGMLFMFAGFFTPSSYARKGPRRFLKDRLLRLGIPILCYDLLINPFLNALLVAAGIYQTSVPLSRRLLAYYSSFHVGTGPLWFAEVLLIFAAAYALARLAAERLPIRRPLALPPVRGAYLAAAVIAAVVAVALATFIVRIWLPLGWVFGPLNLQLPYFPQYVALFIVGILAGCRNALADFNPPAPRRRLIAGLTVALILALPLLLVAGGGLKGNLAPFMGGLHWQSLALSFWEQAACAAMSLALLTLFSRRLNRQSPLAKAASDSAFSAYIIHAPVIILFALAARPVTLHPILKFALALAITVPLTFTLANLLRRHPERSRRIH